MTFKTKFLLSTIFTSGLLYGDVSIPDDQCALIVAAKSSISEVKDFVANEVANPNNVTVYLSVSNHYGVAIGFLKDYEKDKIMSRWKRSGKIPEDALCSKGQYLKKEVYIDFPKSNDSSSSYNESYSNESYSNGSEDFINAINQFQYSGNNSDLKKVYKLAKNRSEKLQAEKLLFENLALSEIFNIKIISSSDSTKEYNNIIEKTIPLLNNLSEMSMQLKTLKKTFEISPKISLEGDYKLKVHFALETGTNMKSNMVPSRDSGFVGNILNQIVEQTVMYKTENQSKIFYLNSNNGHKDSKEISFKINGFGTSALGVDARLNIVSLDLKTKIIAVN